MRRGSLARAVGVREASGDVTTRSAKVMSKLPEQAGRTVLVRRMMGKVLSSSV